MLFKKISIATSDDGDYDSIIRSFRQKLPRSQKLLKGELFPWYRKLPTSPEIANTIIFLSSPVAKIRTYQYIISDLHGYQAIFKYRTVSYI